MLTLQILFQRENTTSIPKMIYMYCGFFSNHGVCDYLKITPGIFEVQKQTIYQMKGNLPQISNIYSDFRSMTI